MSNPIDVVKSRMQIDPLLRGKVGSDSDGARLGRERETRTGEGDLDETKRLGRDEKTRTGQKDSDGTERLGRDEKSWTGRKDGAPDGTETRTGRKDSDGQVRRGGDSDAVRVADGPGYRHGPRIRARVRIWDSDEGRAEPARAGPGPLRRRG